MSYFKVISTLIAIFLWWGCVHTTEVGYLDDNDISYLEHVGESESASYLTVAYSHYKLGIDHPLFFITLDKDSQKRYLALKIPRPKFWKEIYKEHHSKWTISLGIAALSAVVFPSAVPAVLSLLTFRDIYAERPSTLLAGGTILSEAVTPPGLLVPGEEKNSIIVYYDTQTTGCCRRSVGSSVLRNYRSLPLYRCTG